MAAVAVCITTVVEAGRAGCCVVLEAAACGWLCSFGTRGVVTCVLSFEANALKDSCRVDFKVESMQGGAEERGCTGVSHVAG